MKCHSNVQQALLKNLYVPWKYVSEKSIEKSNKPLYNEHMWDVHNLLVPPPPAEDKATISLYIS